MPSFCSPFGFGPKAVMMRPRTGQRKLGRPPAGSAVFNDDVLVASSAAAGASAAATRALCGDSATAILGAGADAGGCSAAVRCGAAGACDRTGAACARISGMTSRSPTRTMVSGAILLARAITMTGLL